MRSACVWRIQHIVYSSFEMPYCNENVEGKNQALIVSLLQQQTGEKNHYLKT